ncbi:hypothetical protein BH20ACI2_BH20ACI2_11270 [soil metagenome]
MFEEAAIVEGQIAFDSGSAIGLAPKFFELPRRVENSYRGPLCPRSVPGKSRWIGPASADRQYRPRTRAGRLDFLVQKHNVGAVKFYEKLGAISNPADRHFKFSGEAFNDLSG